MTPRRRVSRAANACPSADPRYQHLRHSKQNTNMQFEYDPEKLIQEIRKRPSLWDSDNEFYRAKSVRSKLWMEVVHEMLESTVTLTKSEMRELELQLQKKWKCMRDSYIKYVQNPNRTSRPYIYSKYLKFLVGQVNNSSQDVNKTGSDTDEGPVCKRKKKTRRGNVLVLSKDVSEDDDCLEGADDGLSNNSNEEKKEAPVELAMEHPQAFAFASVETRPRDDSEDCDRMFLLSMLPHLKSIPEEFRLNVKMDLMQVLKTAQRSISVLPHKMF